MRLSGGCQCGAVRYAVSGEPAHAALCHCKDCRRSAGAPVVAWAAFPEAGFTLLQGKVTTYNSSGASMRNFCPTCGTGVFFTNAEVLPGLVDIQIATLDDPDMLPPRAQVQVAERIGWMASAHELIEIQRFGIEE